MLRRFQELLQTREESAAFCFAEAAVELGIPRSTLEYRLGWEPENTRRQARPRRTKGDAATGCQVAANGRPRRG